MKLTRRRLLAAASGLVAGGAAGLFAIQPRRRRVAQPDPALPARFARPVRVVVVGGGLAGLSAALELAERGAEVTLVEAAGHLGGKLGGWPVEVGGRRFPMEHGFHGFFAQYYNLTDVLRRLGVDQRLEPAQTYPIAFPDRPAEVFGEAGGLFPFNLLSLYARSENLRWRDLRQVGERMQAMLAWDPVETYRRFDGMDFAGYVDHPSMDRGLVSSMLLPFAKTTLNHPKHVSAAHVLRFMHFYFLGNPDGLTYRFTPDDSMKGVIEPWAERLASLRVQLRTGSPADGFELRDGRIAALLLQSRSTGAATPIAQFDPRQVGASPAQIGTDGSGAPIFVRREEGQVVAMRGLCTHQGCPVRALADGFHCPCHGGRFDVSGRPTAGPPQRPLERLLVAEGAVLEPQRSWERLEADYFVCATDVRGTRRLIEGSPVPDALRAAVGTLAEADPYAVVRLWFDRRADPGRAGFYTTSGFRLLDSIALYDQLQPVYREHAEETGQGVVELHAYAIPPWLDRGPEANRTLMLEELGAVLPELRGAKVLHEELQQQSNFSGFPPGSHATRPGVRSGVPNLFFAGDWVKTDLPVALMEAAVTTGRLAANEVLRASGVAVAPVDTVELDGILA